MLTVCDILSRHGSDGDINSCRYNDNRVWAKHNWTCVCSRGSQTLPETGNQGSRFGSSRGFSRLATRLWIRLGTWPNWRISITFLRSEKSHSSAEVVAVVAVKSNGVVVDSEHVNASLGTDTKEVDVLRVLNVNHVVLAVVLANTLLIIVIEEAV